MLNFIFYIIIMFTPDNITSLLEREIFVFWSNWQGNHFWGSARTAIERFGAIDWQAEWMQWQSFAINTMDGIDKIKEWLDSLVIEAINNPEKVFYLTKIGCGIAWYSEDVIKSILPVFPENIVKPKWW